MNSLKRFALAASGLLLAGCNLPSPEVTGQADATNEESTETAGHAPLALAGPDGATDFITANTPPPPSAKITRDDGIVRDANGRPYHQPLLGQPLPAFTGVMADGNVFNSADMHRWTVIQVWGLWCEDSMADAPYAAALNTAIEQDPDLDFMTVHTLHKPDQSQKRFGAYDSLPAYFEDVGYTLPTVIDEDASIRAALQVGWTPSYFLVSPDGIVRGYRTDLSVAGDGEPVKDFIRDIARVRGEYRKQAALAAPSDDLLSIGYENVAGLSGPTLFTYDAVARAFRGLEVTPGSGMTDGEPYPLYTVTQHGSAGTDQDILYVVEPSWDRGTVGSVLTRHPLVTGPLGERVGETRHGDIPDTEYRVCSLGSDDYAGTLSCAPNAHAGFWRVFRSDDPAVELSEDTPADILGQARLIEMRYIPPIPENRK